MRSTENPDVVILGAGAAGMMCAFEAGRQGRRVLLLDHGDHPGRKILISGGGRCNFTNLGTRAENFLSENPHFARSALARFKPEDMIALVEKHGIRYHEKTLGQLFCDGSARQIVSLLERECGEAGIDLRCGVRVHAVRQCSERSADSTNPRFIIETGAGSFACRTVVVATGGLSIPKMGATGFGYDIARQFGLRVIEPRPALVPLVFAPDDLANWSDLAGVSAEVIAHAEAHRHASEGPDGRRKRARSRENPAPAFREKLLITHRGVSGPAVLQVSSYWRPGAEISVDLAPAQKPLAAMRASNGQRERGSLVSALKRVLPARMAERWAELQLAQGSDWTNAGLDRMEAALHAWTIRPAGTEGFAKAEVTAGGVDTAELDARSMESLRVPGLHFIGEVVDVTGWLGGYNFQWAWASAVACGRSV